MPPNVPPKRDATHRARGGVVVEKVDAPDQGGSLGGMLMEVA